MQIIPINLAWLTVPVGIQATDINQLGTIIAQYLQGQIADTVTFVQTGATDPTQKVTELFFNTSQGAWKYWDVGAGQYLAVTQFVPGDTKTTFNGGDEIQQGWVLLDGRKISAIQGLSANQAAVLNTLFGTGGNIPTVTAAQTLSGLPANGSFSNISVPATVPPSGQIGALPFGASYDPAQSQALASNTETLRGSDAALQTAVVAIRAQSEAVLSSLNGATAGTTLSVKVFVGYPSSQ